METCSVKAEDTELGMVWGALKVGQRVSVLEWGEQQYCINDYHYCTLTPCQHYL